MGTLYMHFLAFPKVSRTSNGDIGSYRIVVTRKRNGEQIGSDSAYYGYEDDGCGFVKLKVNIGISFNTPLTLEDIEWCVRSRHGQVTADIQKQLVPEPPVMEVVNTKREY